MNIQTFDCGHTITVPEGTVGVMCYGKGVHIPLTEGEMDNTQATHTEVNCPECGNAVMVKLGITADDICCIFGIRHRPTLLMSPAEYFAKA